MSRNGLSKPYPLGDDRMKRMSSLPQPMASDRATLLASPTKTTVRPASLPSTSVMVKQIAQGLAGMVVIRQAIDDRAGGMLGKLEHGLVLKRPQHDGIDVLAERAGDVGHAFARAHAAIAGQKNAAAAELGDGRLEADARPQRRLLEDHAEHLALPASAWLRPLRWSFLSRAASLSSLRI